MRTTLVHSPYQTIYSRFLDAVCDRCADKLKLRCLDCEHEAIVTSEEYYAR